MLPPVPKAKYAVTNPFGFDGAMYVCQTNIRFWAWIVWRFFCRGKGKIIELNFQAPDASTNTNLDVEKKRILRKMTWAVGRKNRIIVALLVMFGFVITWLMNEEFFDALLRVFISAILFAGD